MAVAGSLTYETKIDKNGFEKGLNSLTNSVKDGGTKIRNIVAALGIDKIISATMNTLKNSVDSAMKRIDTMNQFTRVMTTITGSSEKAKWALEELKVTTKGTAYGLDVAAKSTQKFVTSGMGIEKSTQQVKIWTDAVAFYGDGTNETFANVTDALAQMVAKGKVEMDQLNRLTDAGIPAVQIYADMVGRSVADVQEDLSKGKISTTQFLEGLQKAFTEGTNKFASISGAAKEAGASWAGTFDNFKAAVTRGMVNIIDSIDEGLKNTSLGGLTKVISNVGATAEKWLKNISNLIKKIDFNSIIKKIQNTLTQNGGKIKNILSSIGKIFNNLKNIVKNFIPVIEKTADVFFSLVDVLGKVGVALSESLKYITSNILGLTNEKTAIHDLIREQESQTTTWGKLKEAREQTLSASSQEIATTQLLAQELKNITDENGNVKDGYESRAKYILGELNQALGTEYSMTGNVIGQYKELKDNIDKLIVSKKAEATLDAYKEEYQTALKNKSEATKELTDLTREYNKQLQISNDKTKTWGERQEAKNKMKELGDSIERQTELISEYGYTIENYENLTKASVSGSAEEIEKAVTSMGVSYDQAKEKANNSFACQVQSQTEYVELIKQNLQQAKENNDTFSQNILENELKTQEQQLQNLTNSFAERTSTIKNLSPEEVSAWCSIAQNSRDEYNKALEPLDKDTRDNIIRAVDNVEAVKGILTGKFSSTGQESTMLFNQNLRLNETVMDKIGQAAGTMNGDTTISTASRILGSNADSKFKEHIKESKGRSATEDYMRGAENGVNAKKGSFLSLLFNVGKRGNQKVRDGLGDGSPSVLAKQALIDYFLGADIGIDKQAPKTLNKMKNYGDEISEEFTKSMNENIINEMTKAVALETGSISATASVKSNNSMLNVIQANFNIDGSVDIDGQKAGKILAPNVSKTLRMAGVY